MERLQNEISWSRSRLSSLEWCKRQYYWQYYGKWGGWEYNASAEARTAYVLSKMTDLPMLLGTAVHETIKRLLLDIQNGTHWIENAEMEVRLYMSKVWKDAKVETWRRDVKHCPPVHELYYGDDPGTPVTRVVGAKAVDCIRTFEASDLYRELKEEGGEHWLAVDEGPSFDDATKHRLDGVTVWALPDFARETPSGCEIWDWKTGSKSEYDELQMRSYALFARDRWGFAAERIQLKAFYLATGTVVDYPCDAALLGAMEDVIRRDITVIRELHEHGTSAHARNGRDQWFPMIENGERCRTCNFRELCNR